MKTYYKDFSDYIKTLATEMQRVFVHDTAQGANVEQDRIDAKTLEMRVIESGSVNMNGEIFTPFLDILFFIIEPMPLDFKGDDACAVYDASFSDAVFLIRKINDKYKIATDNININSVYDEHDANLGGVAVNLKIELKPQCIKSI